MKAKGVRMYGAKDIRLEEFEGHERQHLYVYMEGSKTGKRSYPRT